MRTKLKFQQLRWGIRVAAITWKCLFNDVRRACWDAQVMIEKWLLITNCSILGLIPPFIPGTEWILTPKVEGRFPTAPIPVVHQPKGCTFIYVIRKPSNFILATSCWFWGRCYWLQTMNWILLDNQTINPKKVCCPNLSTDSYFSSQTFIIKLI